MEQSARHRPYRRFADAKRLIFPCERQTCLHCGQLLVDRRTWYVKKYVQTLDGPVFVAGRSSRCHNPDCPHPAATFYASGVLTISLPFSTYGLDVLAFIGWQHDHEHHQFTEIHADLQRRGLLINERTVGKLYRQLLALVAGMTAQRQRRLEATVQAHGGLIWAIDALQPEASEAPLYVLYEVLGGTPVGALQLSTPTTEHLSAWLRPYTQLPFPVLATLSDGEKAGVAALKACWPDAPHQHCQLHFLNNLAEPVLLFDTRLRQQLRNDLGGLSAIPPHPPPASVPLAKGVPRAEQVSATRDAELLTIERQLRQDIRDALNRSSRKPFHWGGLAGYLQLDAIAETLAGLPADAETAALRQMLMQVERAVEQSRGLAADVAAAHEGLVGVALCLRYPPEAGTVTRGDLTSAQIRREMDTLLAQFQPDPKRAPAQTALHDAFAQLWQAWAEDLVACYDVPGLPADNLRLEALFNRVRRQERRISGRTSTRPLGTLGQYQVLFLAESEQELLDCLRQVPVADYRTQRRQLAQLEAPRQHRYRLHHNPAAAIQALLDQHAARRATLAAAQRAIPS